MPRFPNERPRRPTTASWRWTGPGWVVLVLLLPLPVRAERTHGGSPPTAAVHAPPPERRVTLFYTAEVHGTTEPCGCTSDPLGDVSRLAAIIADARRGNAGAVALVDAGGLSYPDGAVSAKEKPAAMLRADFLADQFERMGLLAAALDESDVTGGVDRIRPLRVASNFRGAKAIRSPRVDRVGGIALGILGVGDPNAGAALGARAMDMVESARAEVAHLRSAGAEVIVMLAAVEKSAARRLARDAGADVVILGKRVGEGMPRPEKIGRALLVAPADELQRVGRLEIVLRGATDAQGTQAALEDAGGPDAVKLRREEIDRALERLRVGLANWAAPVGGATPRRDGDTSIDVDFVAAKKREQNELEAERARLEAPWSPPPEGNYVINALIPLRRSLRRDPAVASAMKKLDQRIATVNLKQALPPAPPEPDRPFFVGGARCAGCHKAATVFWNKTVHAHAWKTLVDGGKQSDYKCIGCHVTGFGQVGGSSLGFTKNLESVQCETCHGPGSAHVTGAGNEEPLAIKRDTPETVCLNCHTQQHSDTFQFEAYLRDIVGAGHASERRRRLGKGATGHDLRSAALAKAKLVGAAQADAAKRRLKKM